jgi:hypothetical protein
MFDRIAPHFESLVASLIPGHMCWLTKTGDAAHEVTPGARSAKSFLSCDVLKAIKDVRRLRDTEMKACWSQSARGTDENPDDLTGTTLAIQYWLHDGHLDLPHAPQHAQIYICIHAMMHKLYKHVYSTVHCAVPVVNHVDQGKTSLNPYGSWPPTPLEQIQPALHLSLPDYIRLESPLWRVHMANAPWPMRRAQVHQC